MKTLDSIIDKKKIKTKKNGIYLTSLALENELKTSQTAWEKIFDFNLKEFEKDRKDFIENKLEDHFNVIKKTKKFSKNDVYLEIGCGPAYIGEYLMKTFDVYFVGIDFNLKILRTLKQYFDKKGFKKYLLIHADINDMPLKNDTIDFIYGGGVIEHFADTKHILKQSHRVLKKKGVSFNTVPAFTFSWLPLRFYNNIPNIPVAKPTFEFLHITLLKNRILEKNWGYELSYTKKNLRELHKDVGFSNIEVGPLAFYPSPKKLNNKLLREIYYSLGKNPLTTQIYYVAAQK